MADDARIEILVDALSPYDTGKRAEPIVWAVGAQREGLHPALLGDADEELDRYGKVDFDDDESNTIATIWLERNEHSGKYVVHIQKHRPMGLRIHQEE